MDANARRDTVLSSLHKAGWRLQSLQLPPLPEGGIIGPHAVLHDGRNICVTAAHTLTDPYGAGGTYLFEMVERVWSKAPDDRNLPFSGGAEHVPNLKLWLGLCSRGRHLCASSALSAAADEGKPPTLKHQWEIVKTPEEWEAVKVSIINLGEGRFCIFKLIHDVVPDEDWDWIDDFYSVRGNVRKRLALLTGVEIISSPEEEEGLRMVAHKSLSYIFNKERIEWVLYIKSSIR